MIISIWRYSHLALAVSSFLLLIAASVSGIFLAFEPVTEKLKDHTVENISGLRLDKVIPAIKENFPAVQEVTVDDNAFVLLSYTDSADANKVAYIDPVKGSLLGIKQEQSPFFQWMTNFHRSLFLKNTGRIIVGVTSFLLILIAFSGILLVIQRQKGITRFFSRVEKTSFAQYYHVVFGRLSLFFILALALTGTYLSLYRFFLEKEKPALNVAIDAIKETPALAPADFPAFRNIKLTEVKKIVFPFSDFPEDFYTIELKDRELAINQFTGEILAKQDFSSVYQLAAFSLRWHTGRSGIVWAVLLALASGYIIFFIFSGFAITLNRKKGIVKNKFKPSDAGIIILVGSENGRTFQFAKSVFTQLVKAGKKVYLTDLDNYTVYNNALELLVFASTYGDGDAPSNAKKFLQKLHSVLQPGKIRYSILGFGARSYTHYCQFAYDIETAFAALPGFERLLPTCTVDDGSPQDFALWLEHYRTISGISLSLDDYFKNPHKEDLTQLQVVAKADFVNAVFSLQLKGRAVKKITSGDLLAVYPENDYKERLYSIGVVGGRVQLIVKRHEYGLGSAYLHRLNPGDTISCRMVKNTHFRMPQKGKHIVFISNGTGIAPFLGMIDENNKNKNIVLYCGFRHRSSFSHYEPFLNIAIQNKKLSQYHLALSREENVIYVCHLLEQQAEEIGKWLRGDTVFMICGSLAMLKDVMRVLNVICDNNGISIEQLQEDGRIVSDCY